MSHSPAPAVDAVVFDLGGVLVDWNPRHLYRKIFANEAQMEDFLTRVCNGAWNDAQDRGRPWDEAVRLLQGRFPEFSAEIEAFYLRWPEMLKGDFPETVQILTKLRHEPVRLLALTNWSSETFPFALQRFPFLGWFEGILVSGDEGMAKPDPEIFRLMASRYHLTPARTVFIDDAEKNVKGAHAEGWQTIHFTGAEALLGELQELGLLGG